MIWNIKIETPELKKVLKSFTLEMFKNHGLQKCDTPWLEKKRGTLNEDEISNQY